MSVAGGWEGRGGAGASVLPAAERGHTRGGRLPVAGDATQAKAGATGGKPAKAPTAGPEVEFLTEEDAKDRSGLTEIIKTLKGKDAAVRQAAKVGGFVIAHEDGRHSAAKPVDQVEVHEGAAEPVADARPPDATTTKSKANEMSKTPKRKPKRMSAVDAAAQVLAKAKKPMRAKDLIETMARQGLWTSPADKTTEATLYAAMVREISKKGKDARFRSTTAPSSPPERRAE